MTWQSLSTRQIVLSERAVLWIGLIGGCVLRIVQIATSIGSVDAYYWTRHVELVEKHGVLRAYHAARVVNHPPFGLEIARWTSRLGQEVGLQLFDSFRILQGVADVIAALALVRLARRVGLESPVWAALVYFLSPAVIFISAFHCNSDPLMIMFIVLSVLAVVEQRPVLAGVLIGCATGIKIIAFAALPLLLFGLASRKARLQFLGASAVVGSLIFVPALYVSGSVAIRNIFGYTGWRGGWGIPLVIDVIGFVLPTPKDPQRYVTPLLIAALLALWGFEAWRTRAHGQIEPERLTPVVGLAFLIVLFFAPGFGVQYFLWFLPYLAFLFDRRPVLILHALVSIFAFWLYTSWAGEWPWVYAPGGRHDPLIGVYGLVVWAGIGWAIVKGGKALYGKSVGEGLEPPNQQVPRLRSG